jgi:flagellar assembly protein FliH
MLKSENAAPSRLLKAHDVRGLGTSVIFNFEDLRAQAEGYLEATRRQAREMVEVAESHVAAIRQQAHEAAAKEGRDEGLRQSAERIEQRSRELTEKGIRDSLTTVLPAMTAAAEALVIERDRWLTEWETTAVRLAGAIAEKVIKQRIGLDPGATRAMIREALKLATGSPRIKLRLHPDDVVQMGSLAAETEATLSACGEAQVTADATLSRGSCVIETQHGTIDARIETILDRIVSELLETRDAP